MKKDILKYIVKRKAQKIITKVTMPIPKGRPATKEDIKWLKELDKMFEE